MPQGNPNCIDTIRLCEKEKLQLYADSIDQTKYEWKGPSGFSSNLVNPFKLNILPKDSGYYKLKITIKDCVIKNDSTYVIIEPLKKVYITPDTIICEGDTAKLYCGGGKTYLWSPPDGLTGTTIPNPKAGPDTTTVYSVTMFNDLCPDTTLDVEVRVLSGVVSMQMPDTLRACKGGSIPLQASTNGFDTFKWTGPGGYTSTTRLPTIANMSQAKSGYYRLDCSISTNTCLIGADSTWLDLYPDPTITIDPKPGVICRNDSVQLTASGAASYVWTPAVGVSNPNIANPYFKPQLTTQYVATGTSKDGCKGTDTVMVIVNLLPTPDLGPDLFFCVGDTGYVKCTLQYDSLQWSTGATTDSVMVTVSATIDVTAYKLGCIGTDQIVVDFRDPGDFTLGPDTLLCKGTGYYTNINLPQVDSARWQDDITTLNRTIDTAGTYYVDIYSGKCMYTDTIIVLFDSVPAISIPDSIVCIGTSVTMDATHPRALTYQWNNGPSTPTYTVTGTDLYIVTLTSARCTFVDSIDITVVDPPNPDLQDPMFICQGDSVTFSTPHTYDTYLWNTNATGPSIVAKTHGQYTIIVTLGPCTRYDTTFLNVQVPPVISIGPDLNYCENTTDTIHGPPGFDAYLWNTGATTQDIIPTASGTYSLTVTDDLCIGRDTARVVIDTIPDFKLPNDTMICAGNTVTLTSPITAAAYSWNTGETTKSIVVDSTGEYRLYIQNGTCYYEDTTVVTVVDPPALNIGPDTVVCIGTGVSFGQVITGATYLWNTGATTAMIRDTVAREYSVEVTYKVCKVTDTAELIVDLMPEPDLGPDQLVCEGTVVNLFANTFGDTYIWNTPSSSNSASVTKEGYYTVTVKNGYCTNKDTMFLKVQPRHDVILPPDVTICSNEKYDIVPVTDCTSPIFYWSTGASTRTITVRESGQYLLFVTNGVCQAIDTINVTVVPLPNAEPQYMLLCPDDSASIVLPEGYDYFYDGTMEPFTKTIIYPQVEYNLLMFDKNGCRWPTSIKAELDMDCDRDIFVPNSFTPNHDGANDIFKVEAFELKLVELLIFDRWGHVVFQTQDPAKGWDGRLKGEVCKTDVYEWKLIYEDVYNRRKIRIGHVNLLR